MIATGRRGFSFSIMKKTLIATTGAKSVRIPLLPILWVHHFPDGSAVASLALLRLLSDNLKLN